MPDGPRRDPEMTDVRAQAIDHGDASTETAPAPAPPRAASSPALVLAFARRSFAGREIEPIPPAGLLMGRRAALFGVVLDDPQMSRKHAEITLGRAGPTIRDLGSHNHTYVNGASIEGSQPLRPGDVVRLGSTLFVASATSPADDGDPELVGRSAAIATLRRAIASVAPHDSAVLISGETGSGKELVARAVHRRSGRSGAFVAVNCGGLSEGILESELFGHVRGAFSGAVAGRNGLFREADRGTLFLDELGEMPPALQVKLLRVLETRRVRSVGSEQEVAVDLRVVAATNRDLVNDVVKGRFRADLYARLSQWTIRVPSLRERREDIPLLAQHLLGRRGAQTRPVDPALAEAILLHDWSLNVRGLLNVLSIAVIAATDEELTLVPQVEDALANERRLASSAPEEPPRTPSMATTPPPPSATDRAPASPLGAEEIVAALCRAAGNVAEAARLLGCSRQRLYRLLDARGIDPDRFRAT